MSEEKNIDGVATAFLMPAAAPPSHLVHDEPLFERLNPGRRVGQSVLDLQLDQDGEAARPQKLLVEGREFNIAGLDVEADDLVQSSPCVHEAKKRKPCADCTSDAVKKAHKERRRREKELMDAANGAAVEESAP